MLDTPATGTGPPPEDRDLAVVTAAIVVTAHAVQQPAADSPPVSGAELLDALVLLRWAQTELAGLEPVLIAAARTAGVSWQALAPALGVASRQAAERRYLRSVSIPTDQLGDTRDDRVQAERDRRAARRAVAQWANDNTADLRGLAGQITALTDLGEAATGALTQLHRALGDADATALPDLLAAAHQHLPDHPDLAAQIDIITTRTDQIRRQPPRRSGETS
ncbi:hypothetical protein [Actinoplanes regularis]|uniref:Type III effector protein n=1 Tax=Actinoplanes regularis TaxID=52697 RepID=A0A239BVU3_9ACTN|nr:hypothetical protein [Actinoplanes regularis]GIE88288.1 hypothetical protein Are01nite_47680 [Actinoplanes regularis]SNS11283.1 hypothetical protein SAMN06264365_110127 [Actinoplanes regularis]